MECFNCVRLGRCRTTNLDLVKTHYVCDQWEAMKSEEEYQARVDSLKTFGVDATINALITLGLKEEE